MVQLFKLFTIIQNNKQHYVNTFKSENYVENSKILQNDWTQLRFITFYTTLIIDNFNFLLLNWDTF